MPEWGGLGIHATFAHRMPPLATMVLAALARREGWEVRTYDLNYEKPPDDPAPLVGISVWTSTAPQAYALADAYRARGTTVMLGGVHPSLVPSEALKHADCVVAGEAEDILGTVLSDFQDGTLQPLYHGRWGGMDSVPMVHEWFDLLDAEPFWRYLPRNTVQTTRGCRFNCDFCSVIRINGRGSRHRDPEEVVEELRLLTSQGQKFGPFRYVALADDDLAADLEYTVALSEAIVRSGVKVAFSAQGSIGIANDPAIVALLARAGMKGLFCGLESVSREALIECNKKNRPHKFQESIALLHRHKIMVEAGLIFGFDHDDETVFDTTVAFAEAIKVDTAHFAILTPLPGTHTFHRMVSDGRVTSFDWGRYDLYHAVFEPTRMSQATLDAGLWRAYRDFYARRPRARRWCRHVGMLLSPPVGTGVTVTNWQYGRRYKPDARSTRPPFEADPEDVERILLTSAVPADDAVLTAVGGVPVALAPRTREPAPFVG